MSETTLNHILEIFYILIGLQFLYTAYRSLRSTDKSKSLGTAAFWTILAILFIGGPYIPNVINGILVLSMGVLTLFKQVKLKILSTSQIRKQKRDLPSMAINSLFLQLS